MGVHKIKVSMMATTNLNIRTDKLDVPNTTTADAIEEGKRIASDKSVKGYKNMKDLRKAQERIYEKMV